MKEEELKQHYLNGEITGKEIIWYNGLELEKNEDLYDELTRGFVGTTFRNAWF